VIICFSKERDFIDKAKEGEGWRNIPFVFVLCKVEAVKKVEVLGCFF